MAWVLHKSFDAVSAGKSGEFSLRELIDNLLRGYFSGFDRQQRAGEQLNGFSVAR